MTVARVLLWGRTIGAVSQPGPGEVAVFQYDPQFARSGIQVAPLTMPLGPAPYAFPALPRGAFHGLPGLLSDTLPDRYGNALIHAWLARQGRSAESFSAVERLGYTGSRGMGALEFEPVLGPTDDPSNPLDIAELVELASQVLSQRDELRASLQAPEREAALARILAVGTSAGGARAKAVIAYHPATGQVRSGQSSVPPGFEHWLIKFDGVRHNRDRELDDPTGYGAIEYAYSLMAHRAGIDMAPCRLLHEGGRRHFMTRRFDRTASGGKLHMLTLGAMAHMDFNQAGAHSYEQAFGVMRELGLSMSSIEQQFVRMAFNILARNQDDHVKNIAFLMNQSGVWRLSPAYDMTYAYNPLGDWTSSHQMSLNGKRDGFELADFVACGRVISLKRGRAEALVDEVRSAVRCWAEFAALAGVEPEWAREIGRQHRLEV